MRDAGLSSHVSGLNLTMRGPRRGRKSEDVPQTVNWAGPQGYFPIAYRGWAAAGYTATGARATTPIVEGDFGTTTASGDPYDNKDDACQELFGGSCPTDTSVNNTGFGDYDPARAVRRSSTSTRRPRTSPTPSPTTPSSTPTRSRRAGRAPRRRSTPARTA